MRRLLLAFRTFFAILFHWDFAEEVARLEQLAKTGPAKVAATEEAQQKPGPPPAPQKPAPPPVVQDPALTLLGAMQREARFIDFIQESLDGYSDAQVGAAVREVHRGCRQVLERCFRLAPIVDQEEGTDFTLERPFNAGRYRLTGNVTDQSPVTGRVVHAGWEAKRCELPQFHGDASTANVLAPAEIEVK